MNFFERQAQARRWTRRLVWLFLLALLVIVTAVTGLMVSVIATFQTDSPLHQGRLLPDAQWLHAHPGLVVLCALIVLGVMLVAMLYKSSALADGGGAVARAAGGERVPHDTQDPQLKLLLNVVEEIAIASGVPVPAVYVLPHETGINAFAAGYNPSNAAVTVTRGTLALLSRSELQGVIAHEFSHIVNGDMRLNLRLISLLFGLTVIASIARMVLRIAPRGGSDDRRSAGAMFAVIAAAAALYALGYIGLFFGRMIQAAVSRKREALADASAVQFTREPLGLRNALVKIGATVNGSYLVQADADEVAHMLFAPGMRRLFATHPPLEERIRAIDPGFRPSEFAAASVALAPRLAALESPVPPPAARERLEQLLASTIALQPQQMVSQAGQWSDAQLALARALRVTLPPGVEAAAGSGDAAMALMLALALDDSAALREQQLTFIGKQLGDAVARSCLELNHDVQGLNPMQRLPALQRVLPAMRALPLSSRVQLLQCLNGLLQRGGRLSLRQFALRKLIQVQLRDIDRTRPPGGRLGLPSAAEDCRLLLAALATLGSIDATQIKPAFSAGMRQLYPEYQGAPLLPENWPMQLDSALSRLDLLTPAAKQQLLGAMMIAVSTDGQVTVSEAELLRTASACLHCPLPLLSEAAAA